MKHHLILYISYQDLLTKEPIPPIINKSFPNCFQSHCRNSWRLKFPKKAKHPKDPLTDFSVKYTLKRTKGF